MIVEVSRQDIQAWAESLGAPVTTRGALVESVMEMLSARDPAPAKSSGDMEELRWGRHTFRLKGNLWALTKGLGEAVFFVLTSSETMLLSSFGLALPAMEIIRIIKESYKRLSDDELRLYEAVLRYSREKGNPPKESDLSEYLNELSHAEIEKLLSSMIQVKGVFERSVTEGTLLLKV